MLAIVTSLAELLLGLLRDRSHGIPAVPYKAPRAAAASPAREAAAGESGH
jgi:hypothetical protein